MPDSGLIGRCPRGHNRNGNVGVHDAQPGRRVGGVRHVRQFHDGLVLRQEQPTVVAHIKRGVVPVADAEVHRPAECALDVAALVVSSHTEQIDHHVVGSVDLDDRPDVAQMGGGDGLDHAQLAVCADEVVAGTDSDVPDNREQPDDGHVVVDDDLSMKRSGTIDRQVVVQRHPGATEDHLTEDVQRPGRDPAVQYVEQVDQSSIRLPRDADRTSSLPVCPIAVDLVVGQAGDSVGRRRQYSDPVGPGRVLVEQGLEAFMTHFRSAFRCRRQRPCRPDIR